MDGKRNDNKNAKYAMKSRLRYKKRDNSELLLLCLYTLSHCISPERGCRWRNQRDNNNHNNNSNSTTITTTATTIVNK